MAEDGTGSIIDSPHFSHTLPPILPSIFPDPEPTNRKEIGINKPTPFDGDRKKVESFIQECRVYLQVNKAVYNTDEARIAFILSFMKEKEALKWKLTFLRSITNADGDLVFPSTKEFMDYIADYFTPTLQTQEAIHQLALLKQGKKTAEEIVTEFRLLIAHAGYTVQTPSDHLHLIEKLQKVLNPSLVKKIMLLDNPPTTIDEWVRRAITIDGQYRMTMDVLNRKMNDGRSKNDDKKDHTKWSNYFDKKKRREERDPDAMDVDAMTTEKRIALMKKGACFICEETGHLARDHKEHVEKKKGKAREYTSFPQKKQTIQEIHALLQSLSPKETKALFDLQDEEKKEEKDNDDEDF